MKELVLDQERGSLSDLTYWNSPMYIHLQKYLSKVCGKNLRLAKDENNVIGMLWYPPRARCNHWEVFWEFIHHGGGVTCEVTAA